MVIALSVIHQLDRVMRKTSNASTAVCRYQTHVKYYCSFTRVHSQLFSRLEILVKHRSLYDKSISSYAAVYKTLLQP